MKNHDLTDELKVLCDTNWLPTDLVNELIKAEKWNLWNKWISHKSMIETLIRKYIN